MRRRRSQHYDIRLTADEALVLSDWLARFIEAGPTHIEDQAELRALWNLDCVLEEVLVEPFHPDYRQLVQDARDRLRDQED